MNEHQEESEQPSATTSEKENRTASQGTEATQPATSLKEETEIADYGPLQARLRCNTTAKNWQLSSTLG